PAISATDVLIFLLSALEVYHHDHSSTLNVRASRRAITSATRRFPAVIFANPVMPGLRSPDPFSISVVTENVFPMGGVAAALLEPETSLALLDIPSAAAAIAVIVP